jgi:hypothetical protein
LAASRPIARVSAWPTLAVQFTDISSLMAIGAEKV